MSLSKLTCGLCWEAKHKCDRKTPYDRCRGCHPSTATDNQTAPFVQFSAPSVKAQLGLHEASSSILNAVGLGSSALNLDFRPSDSEPFGVSFNTDGNFSHNNFEIVDRLDNLFRRNFCAKLKATSRDSILLSNAILVGGYLHVLGSITSISEEVRITIDNEVTDTEHHPHNLGLHFRHLLTCRIEDLAMAVVFASRENNYSNREVYTAASILYKVFKQSSNNSGLKFGNSSHPALVSLKGNFLDWLSSVKRELHQYLGQACGKAPHWQSAVKGSLKSLRRSNKTLRLDMYLRQNWTSPENMQNTVKLLAEQPLVSRFTYQPQIMHSPHQMSAYTCRSSERASNSLQDYPISTYDPLLPNRDMFPNQFATPNELSDTPPQLCFSENVRQIAFASSQSILHESLSSAMDGAIAASSADFPSLGLKLREDNPFSGEIPEPFFPGFDYLNQDDSLAEDDSYFCSALN